MEPLKNKGIVTHDQLKSIFLDIDVILSYNQLILDEIQMRKNAIGDVFLKMVPN